MGLRHELLNRLKRLSLDQFQEVLFRLSIDVSYLPEVGASRAQRATALILRLEQEVSGLGRLQRLLDDLNWFKDFLPEGAYPVGGELLEREEARERQAMEEAAARDEDPQDYRITPEKFYTFRPEAAWLGVFRGWDSPRGFHSELVARVVDVSGGKNGCPMAAIIGSGGSGKSVALRRLAVDLAEQGHKVWWVEEPERLLRFGLSQLADAGDGPQFLLVDEVQSLEDEYVRRFRRDLQKHRSLILVVAGRRLPVAFRARLAPGVGLFVPDEAGDRLSILAKIGETAPAWAETARQLAAERLRGERLIRILVVLARQKAVPRNLQDLETTFLEILADDIERIRSSLPGLAEAVVDAAAVREVGRDISRQTLIVLADYHQPGVSIPTLLNEINGNPRWKLLAPLLSHDPEYDAVRFHHDELAEGLVVAGQRGLLGVRVIGDDAWRKATLDTVVSRGSASSSSYALSEFVRNRPGLLSREQAVGYVRQLLAAGNGHHAYLRLIVHDAVALEQEDRLELLVAAARVAPFNNWLWGTVWAWIQRHRRTREQRADFLEQLYGAGCRAISILIPLLQCLASGRARSLAKEWLRDRTMSPQVLCRSLDLLGKEATEQARRLLADPATHPHVVCRCLDVLEDEEAKEEAERLLAKSKDKEVLCRSLDLLGKEATEQARRLLADPATHPHVVCRCVGLLGEATKPFAVQCIRSWTETDAALVARCFQVAGATLEGRKAAEEMLEAWDESVPPQLRVVALRARLDTPVRTQRAHEVLDVWRRQFRPLVTAALTAFWNDPDSAIGYCRAVLARWRQEIVYRHKRRLPEYAGYIVKALSHPGLRQDARKAVQEMLLAEAESPGFLSGELRRQAENIMSGEWPPWSAPEEESSSLGGC